MGRVTKVAAVHMCQRALFVNAALYVFFEGKEIEARIKWWNPIQISRTVPLNVFVALLNKGLVAVRVLPPIWTETMIYTVYFINKLAVSSHSGAVLYCFWCSTPALGPLWTISVCLDVPHMLAYWKRYGTGSWHPRELWICT